ncbi:hemin uptake protein HemP [Loktanella sp. D2R18]|uniref:hemin uptake protein HemP n=1 Tax=Rhodobacterales TaxID=204455 RepID=UPI000DE828AE|nr:MULTISPECIES: hemin uptake protein HemP [Rhodobacterales]MCG3269427.1 hemin uptake protein HemP [Yoonia sp. I 8.24]MDO6590839.1 hemin uptake protein HemP [Yoonia sp. 1_MG-2023]RBW43268.1 hemin uptake protein HemP [Loktanella sp. D2R18]
MSFHSVPRPQPSTAPKLPTYDAEVLTQDGDLANIVLRDQTYTLRITRAGKLILTK